MERLTVGDFFDRTALGIGDREALVAVDQRVRWGYREVYTRVSHVAKGLMGLGVESGDHVAVFAPNRVEWVLLHFAVAKIGAVLVPIDPALGAEDLTHVLVDSDASTLFVAERIGEPSQLDVLLECCPELREARPGRLASRRFPMLKRVVTVGDAPPTCAGTLAWTDALTAGAGITDHLLRRRQEGVEFADLAALHYTAGTTGAPRGVELTHLSLVNNAVAAGDCMRLGRRDRLCVPVPFARPHGSVLGTLAALGRGATMIVPAEHFDAGKTLGTMASERCTALHAEPRMLVSLLRHPDVIRVDLSSSRTGVVMGAAAPVGVMAEATARLHLPELTVAYGQAEATAAITQTRPEDSVDLRTTTVGRALPNVEVKIVHPKTGVALPVGEEGELCCRGSLVMRGYYKQPELTAATVGRNGWLRTGDLAVMDQYGYCMLTGRRPLRSS
jgi:fatty-acyl-CoA synthase